MEQTMTAIMLEAEESGASDVVYSCGFKGPLECVWWGSSESGKVLHDTKTSACGWGGLGSSILCEQVIEWFTELKSP